MNHKKKNRKKGKPKGPAISVNDFYFLFFLIKDINKQSRMHKQEKKKKKKFTFLSWQNTFSNKKEKLLQKHIKKTYPKCLPL